MSLPQLRVGVVGCGRIAREVHLRILKSLPDVQAVALAEADANALREAHALAPHATTYSGADALLADAALDAVVISLPNALHAPLAIAAFERGLHVYLEKPLGIRLDESRAVVEAWQKAETIGAVGFNYRFDPLLREARNAIADGAIGRLIGIRSSFCTPTQELPAWKSRRESGGGVLLDLASHHLDLVRYLTGQEIIEVAAQIHSVRHEEDTAATTLVLDNRVLVQGFFSQSAIERDLWEFEGENGRLRIDRYNMTRVELTRAGELGLKHQFLRAAKKVSPNSALHSARYTHRKIREPNASPSYRGAWNSFIEAMRGGYDSTLATPPDGLRNLEIIHALEESARQKRNVGLPLFATKPQ